MSKRLAIKGHRTRGKEVIELLEMMGGKNALDCSGHVIKYSYYVCCDCTILYDSISNENNDFAIFTLEKFLAKFPFKVGDKVHIYVQNDDIDGRYDVEVAEIDSMRWNPARCKIAYKMKDINREFYKEELKPYKEEINNKENKLFGTLSKPVETKSCVVGLKDGKVIECGVNKEIVMNENKPLFKTGDIVKLKGCPDKNVFWIIMDVVKDGYIFNDGKKYSFDDQHHYEKSNREIINMTKETLTPAPDITANITDKNNYDIGCPDGYEFYDENGNLIGKKIMMRAKKTTYPKTYKECCDVLGIGTIDNDAKGYKHFLLIQFQELIIARDAYWKIAGEQRGLDKRWIPDLENEELYCIQNYNKQIVISRTNTAFNKILIFPTEEMRDAFYDNFKNLIENCKELL